MPTIVGPPTLSPETLVFLDSVLCSLVLRGDDPNLTDNAANIAAAREELAAALKAASTDTTGSTA